MKISGAVNNFINELGVIIPASFQNRLQALLNNVQLAGKDAFLSPLTIAETWRNLLTLDENSVGRESLERIGLIGVLFDLTDRDSAQMHEAFLEAKLNLRRSRIEMAMRLGSRLYMMGRMFQLDRTATNSGSRLLTAAIWYFDYAIEHESWLRPSALQKLYGLRGVARLLLARAGLDLDLLPRAAEDLDRSKAFGDTSVQNLIYRRECSIRRYDKLREPSVLAKLEAQIKEGGPRDHQYWSDLAKAHQYRASRQIEFQEGDPLPDLSAGIAACDSGLEIPAEDQASLAVFYNLRGFLRFQSVQSGNMDRDEAHSALGLAIIDLRRAAAFGLGGASLSQALMRRANLISGVDLAAARDDLEQALASLTSTEEALRNKLSLQIRASLLDYRLRDLIAAKSWQSVPEICLELLGFTEHVTRHLFVLQHALKACWAVGGLPTSHLMVATEQVVACCAELLERDSETDENERIRLAVLLGYAAGLSRRLDGGSPSPRTLRLFREAVSRQPLPPASLIGQAADSALQAGKNYAKLGAVVDAEGFFEDSVKWYEAALTAAGGESEDPEENFLPVVCHSRAGEAYLRLRSGSLGADVTLQKSIDHFEAARALGNETPELLGLLGDAHYRIGFQKGSVTELRAALELKLAARAAGHHARENFSVVARIYQRLFELQQDASLLACAIEAAAQAYDISPAWPWPLFQMADLSVCHEFARQQAASHLPVGIKSRKEVGWILDGNRTALLETAVRCAVETGEFRKAILGGRSRVFVLDDPHRLLSATLVIKPTKEPSNAKREMRSISDFRTYLHTNGFKDKLGLPTPIALIEHGGEFFYAMERARADGLDRRILGQDGTGYQGQEYVIRALECLALFHRWAATDSITMASNANLRKAFASYVKNLGAATADVSRLAGDFASLLPNLPIVRKCDAHPENWLVQPNGRIIMIDLEATSRIPCLLDVAQLLDDYPVFAVNPSGWKLRLDLCRDYWLNVTGAMPAPQVIELGYSTLVIFRSVFGLQFCTREKARRNASSALGALDQRIGHYQRLLTFIAKRGLSARVRELAAEVLTLSASKRTASN